MDRAGSQGDCGLRDVLKEQACWWAGLCLLQAICLAWGMPGVELTGCWAGAGLGPGANKIERGLQSGASQCQCPCSRTSSQKGCGHHPRPQVSSSHLQLPWRFTKIRRWVWPRLLSNSCFCLGPGGCEILCSPFKSGVSICPSPLGLLKVSPAGLQSQTFWGLIFPVKDPQAGEPSVELRPFTPWGEPLAL